MSRGDLVLVSPTAVQYGVGVVAASVDNIDDVDQTRRGGELCCATRQPVVEYYTASYRSLLSRTAAVCFSLTVFRTFLSDVRQTHISKSTDMERGVHPLTITLTLTLTLLSFPSLPLTSPFF